MTRLFAQPAFIDFGPCTLQVGASAPSIQHVMGGRPAALKGEIRERCPRQPGVYGMIDLHGELIYVGKAKNLRARLMTYFRPRSRDPKAGRIVAHSKCIVWEAGPDEFAALHRELELIRRWRPRCNVQNQPRSWQHTYVCLGRSPAPYVFLSRRPPAGVLAKFGPILSGANARAAVRRLNDWFQLRECPKAQEMIFAEQADLFPIDRAAGCLRHELGTCLGPCIGACSQADYARQTKATRDFLAGQNLAPLQILERAMQEAAIQQQYERAAVLRDKLTALNWLHRQLERMRHADAMAATVYPIKGHDDVLRWYLLHGGRAVAAVAANGRLSAKDTVAKLATLAEQNGQAGRPAERIAGVMLLASWLRRNEGERQKLLPLRICKQGPTRQ